MAEKTVAQKLQIKPNTSVWVSHRDRAHFIEPYPDGVTTADDLASATVGFIFADGPDEVREVMNDHKADLAKPSILWVAYPKSPKVNLNRDSLWKLMAEYRFRPNSQIAVNEDWSAMRYRADKEDEAPFTGGGNRE